MIASETILTLNVGSSSLKFAVHAREPKGLVERLSGSGKPGEHGYTLEWRDIPTATQHRFDAENAREALRHLFDMPGAKRLPPPKVVAHRIVHGGPTLREHCILTPAVAQTIDAAKAFAPLHVPAALGWFHDAQAVFPNAIQVACFDSVFHRTMPPLARLIPLPIELLADGIERMGFHGLSCESIVQQLGDDLPARVIIAHLGGGSSVTAVRDGQSVDTTMGLTPLGGCVMSSRPGDLDPGVLLYLLRTQRCTVKQLDALIEKDAGLKAISEHTGDLKVLSQHPDDPKAILALDYFMHSVAKSIAGMLTVLGGADLIVFTGGVGENATEIRQQVVDLIRPVYAKANVKTLPSMENERMAFHAARFA